MAFFDHRVHSSTVWKYGWANIGSKCWKISEKAKVRKTRRCYPNPYSLKLGEALKCVAPCSQKTSQSSICSTTLMQMQKNEVVLTWEKALKKERPPDQPFACCIAIMLLESAADDEHLHSLVPFHPHSLPTNNRAEKALRQVLRKARFFIFTLCGQPKRIAWKASQCTWTHFMCLARG